MRVFHGDILKSIQSELMTLQPSSKLPQIICFVQQGHARNMKMCTWPSFKLPWFITARTTRESKWVYEEINVMGDCKMMLGLTSPFWNPLTTRNLLLYSDVAEWISHLLWFQKVLGLEMIFGMVMFAFFYCSVQSSACTQVLLSSCLLIDEKSEWCWFCFSWQHKTTQITFFRFFSKLCFPCSAKSALV